MNHKVKLGRISALVLSVVLVVACTPQTGGGGSPEELGRELAGLAGELGVFEQTLDRGADWAWDASVEAFTLEQGREPTADEATRGRAVIRAVLGEFLTPEIWQANISRVYAEHFTADELEAIVGFYGSPVGRKVLQLENQLTQEFDESLGEAFADDALERFITRLDEALTEELGLGDGSGS